MLGGQLHVWYLRSGHLLDLHEGEPRLHFALTRPCIFQDVRRHDYPSPSTMRSYGRLLPPHSLHTQMMLASDVVKALDHFATDPPLQAIGVRHARGWIFNAEDEICFDAVVYVRGGVRVRDILDVVVGLKGGEKWLEKESSGYPLTQQRYLWYHVYQEAEGME